MAARKTNRRSTASRSVRPLRKEMTVDGEKYRFVLSNYTPLNEAVLRCYGLF